MANLLITRRSSPNRIRFLEECIFAPNHAELLPTRESKREAEAFERVNILRTQDVLRGVLDRTGSELRSERRARDVGDFDWRSVAHASSSLRMVSRIVALHRRGE